EALAGNSQGLLSFGDFSLALLPPANRAGWEVPHSHFIPATLLLDNRLHSTSSFLLGFTIVLLLC
ncbi:hypothetical protein, partial [Sphingobacterium sp.]|uniref:hypothetical protein n=1 Tax=Sphingobacterium sp. TaxID=341027 RepID=UPI0031E2123B